MIIQRPILLSGQIARLADLVPGVPARPACVSTGASEIDAALPWGGLPCGLHEFAGPAGDGARVGFAASLTARRTGPVLWCRSRSAALQSGGPYGPGMAAFGLMPDRLILVEASKPAELLWAMEEGARTAGLAAVVGEDAAPDLTASRRLQLAAEAGRGLLVLLADELSRTAAASALTRWLIRSEPSLPEAGGPGRSRWNIELRRCRGGVWPQNWMVEWDDAALSLSVVPLLSDRSLAAVG
jgi:protein ImuA